MFYMARDGDNYMKLQLHRVGLDGKGDVRLTDPTFTTSHVRGGARCAIGGAASRRQQVLRRRLSDARSAAGDAAASTRTGKVVGAARQERPDAASTQLGLKKVEMFTYKAADGKTTLYGTIAFPSNFDPSKKYPTLMSVYGGPASGSNVPTETFADAERDDRVRLPGREPQLARGARAWASRCSTRST